MKKLLIVMIMAAFALGACGKKQAPAKPATTDDKSMTTPPAADPNAPKPDETKPAEPAK